jgi:hypothetical protein
MNAGKVLEWARVLLDLVLDLVPPPVARQLLDEAAVKRANAVADAAELAKFGPER